MPQPVAALFDLDGVIIDSEPQYTKFWTTIGKKYYPNDPNFARDVKGQTLAYIIAKYFPKSDDSRQITQELEDYEAQMDYPYIIGALDFVRALSSRKIPTAIVTSSNLRKMQQLYRHYPDFKSHFTTVLTAENCSRSKPAPDCYLNAAQQLRTNVKQCIVFEDSLNGLKSGRSAGAHVVGLSTTLPPAIISPWADAIIPNFSHFTSDDMLSLV